VLEGVGRVAPALRDRLPVFLTKFDAAEDRAMMNQTPTNDELETQAIALINEAARLLESLPEADLGKLQPAVKRLVEEVETFGDIGVSVDDEL
jgi:hypothetical protein